MMGEGCCGGGCGCHEDDKEECGPECECDDLETLTDENNLLLSALINVLEKKGMLTQAELDAAVDEIQADEDDDIDTTKQE